MGYRFTGKSNIGQTLFDYFTFSTFLAMFHMCLFGDLFLAEGLRLTH